MKKTTILILAVMAVLTGSVSCKKANDIDRDPLSTVALSIIPDFSDGSVYSYSDDGSFFLRASVTPGKYIDKFGNDGKYIYRADFRKVITKVSPEASDFSVIGEISSASVEETYLTASFTLSKDEMGKMWKSDYMVSLSIEDTDGVCGTSASYVPVSWYPRDGRGGDFIVVNGHKAVRLADNYWATENVGECDNVAAVAGPGIILNDWGEYFYNQGNAITAAKSWGEEVFFDDEKEEVTEYEWSLPTESQWQALLDNCDWTWTSQDDKAGYRVSDKSDSSIFIFLPAAGYFVVGTVNAVMNQGQTGSYWSADDERILSFDTYGREITDHESVNGFSVRPLANYRIYQ